MHQILSSVIAFEVCPDIVILFNGICDSPFYFNGILLFGLLFCSAGWANFSPWDLGLGYLIQWDMWSDYLIQWDLEFIWLAVWHMWLGIGFIYFMESEIAVIYSMGSRNDMWCNPSTPTPQSYWSLSQNVLMGMHNEASYNCLGEMFWFPVLQIFYLHTIWVSSAVEK